MGGDRINVGRARKGAGKRLVRRGHDGDRQEMADRGVRRARRRVGGQHESSARTETKNPEPRRVNAAARMRLLEDRRIARAMRDGATKEQAVAFAKLGGPRTKARGKAPPSRLAKVVADSKLRAMARGIAHGKMRAKIRARLRAKDSRSMGEGITRTPSSGVRQARRRSSDAPTPSTSTRPRQARRRFFDAEDESESLSSLGRAAKRKNSPPALTGWKSFGAASFHKMDQIATHGKARGMAKLRAKLRSIVRTNTFCGQREDMEPHHLRVANSSTECLQLCARNPGCVGANWCGGAKCKPGKDRLGYGVTFFYDEKFSSSLSFDVSAACPSQCVERSCSMWGCCVMMHGG